MDQPAPALPPRFAVQEGRRVICIVCRGAAPRHLPTCPLVALDAEVKALVGTVGMCVANIKDALEAIERILRDDPP